MQWKYKYHHTIKSLPLIINDAHDQKRALMKKIHTLDDLNYEKGSQKNDYLIREQIKSIQDELTRYKGAMELFDYGKNGDLKAYEDILIFFVENFIDKLDAADKLELLKLSVKEVEGKNEARPLRYAGRDIISINNVHIVDLRKSLRSFEIQFYNNFKPQLLKFLNDVNHILFYEKFLLSMNSIRLKEVFSSSDFDFEYLMDCIKSFIWFNNKIDIHQCTDISLKDFILFTFRDSGIEKILLSHPGNTKSTLDDIINKILAELGEQLQEIDNFQCVNDNLSQEKDTENKSNKSVFSERLRLLTRIKALLNDLIKIDTCEEDSALIENWEISGVEEKESGQCLFHVQEPSSPTLKSISNHMVNVLIFVYSWILRELYQRNIPSGLVAYLNNSISYTKDFARLYCTAVKISTGNDSQKKLFKADTELYISMDHAKNIIDSMNKIYYLLSNALASIYNLADLNKQTSPNKEHYAVLLKKINIVNDHLNSISERMQKV